MERSLEYCSLLELLEVLEAAKLEALELVKLQEWEHRMIGEIRVMGVMWERLAVNLRMVKLWAFDRPVGFLLPKLWLQRLDRLN